MTAASLRSTLAFGASIPCAVALAPIYVVALGLAGFAASVRWLARRWEPAFTEWAALIEYHPTLGWKPKPGLDGHYLADGDDVYKVTTDAEGWPGRHALDNSEVVVIGDSFAFGYGIDPDASFAARVRSAKVKAVGAPGYSMVQGVRLMEELGERLRGKLVVWFVFLENDLQDNLSPEMRRYRAPFVRWNRGRDTWEITDAHVSRTPWRASNLDTRRLFPSFCVAGARASRAYGAAEYLLARAEQVCTQAGAALNVVTIPSLAQLTVAGRGDLARRSGDPEHCDAGFPDRQLRESCTRLRIAMVSGREHLTARDYKRREGIHWCGRGHQRVARIIEELYETFRAAPRTGPDPAHTLPLRMTAGGIKAAQHYPVHS